MTEVTTYLAPLDSTDIGLVRAWRNSWEVWKWCRQNDLISDSEQVRWYNRQSEDPTIRMYKLMVKADKDPAPVGVGGLTSLDFFNSRAELSFYLCPEMQGQGLENAFLPVLLGHAFTNLGLGLVYAEVFDGNPIADVLRRLGFAHDGVRRDFYWKDGRRIDAHLYSITAREWHDLGSRDARSSGGAARDGAMGENAVASQGTIDVAASSGVSADEISAEVCPAKAHRQLRRGARAKGTRGEEPLT